MKASKIPACRSCGLERLASVFDLGALSSCGVFPNQREPDPTAGPLNLVRCADCGLVQLEHDYEGDELFRHTYGYRSGLNESMVSHLSSIVTAIKKIATLNAGDVVLDIGSNDGTLLSFYQGLGLQRIGIDPTSARFKQFYQPDIAIVPDFFSAESFAKAAPGRRAKVITSISMFYDLPAPNAFVADVATVLDPEGIWVLEQSYLPLMVDRNSFDTVCHEHLEYYGLRQIDDLLTRHRLRVFDTKLNDVNGGSFQVWACHESATHARKAAEIDRLLTEEKAAGYGGPEPVLALKRRVDLAREETLAFLRDCKAKGKLVHGYGASTKGNTLLQYFGITPDLVAAIAERNVDKFGCRTPGTNIPIVSEEDSRAAQPDYYFVLPWHFRDAFLEREKQFLQRGGKFVFPLPKLEIVSQ